MPSIVGTATANLDVNSARFEQGMRRAEGRTQQGSDRMKNALNSLRAVAGPVAAAVAGIFSVATLRNAVAVGNEIENLNRQFAALEGTTETFFVQNLSRIAEQASVSTATIADLASKAAINTAEFLRGNATIVQSFADLGVSEADVAGRTQVELIELILGRLSQVDDVLERQRLAARIVGEEFGKLVNPLLDEIDREGGINRLREENLFTFSQGQIDNALNFGRALDAMGQAFSTGLQTTVLNAFTDSLEEIGREDFQQHLSAIGELLGSTIVFFGRFAFGLTSFVDVIIREGERFFEAQAMALQGQSVAFGAGTTQPLPQGEGSPIRAGLPVDDSALLDEQRRQTALAELQDRQDKERNDLMRLQVERAFTTFDPDDLLALGETQERIASAFEALTDQQSIRRAEVFNPASLQAELDAQNEAARGRRQADEGDREAQLQFASDLFFHDLSRSFATSVTSFDFEGIGLSVLGAIQRTITDQASTVLAEGLKMLFGGLFRNLLSSLGGGGGGGLGGLFAFASRIPFFQEGGFVGRSGLAFVDRGETILPPGRNLGSQTFNFNVTGNVDDATESAIFRMSRPIAALVNNENREARLLPAS